MLFAGGVWGNSFMLECNFLKENDPSSSNESLYFFNKINRYTGYFLKHEDGKNIYNFYGTNIPMTYWENKCKSTANDSSSYFFNCSGRYKENKYFQDSHEVGILRKDLGLTRLQIMDSSIVGKIRTMDFWECKLVEKDISKKELKRLKNEIKIRDNKIKDARSSDSKRNKI